MHMLYWNRLIVIVRPLATAVCLLMLVGCGAMQKTFFPRPSANEAVDLVSSAVENSNLWWPIMFAGFLALLAGIINLVFLRGSAKLLVIGVLLALTPPIADMVLSSIMPWVGFIVALAGLALLSIVIGRWYGHRDIMKRANARADYIVDNGKASLTKKQTAQVLTHLGDRDFDPEYEV